MDGVDIATVMRGIEAWAAMAGEDPVPEAVALWRARRCAGCAAHARGPLGSGWCGRIMEAGRDARGEWCGCLVTMTVGGVVKAAGKTRSGREACPRGEWWEYDGAGVV